YEHYRDGERFFRQQLIQRLLLPEGIIRRMCQEFLIKPDLIQAALMGHFAGRASSEPRFVIVDMVGPPFLFVLACRLLIIPIDQLYWTKSAIMRQLISNTSR